MKKLSTIIKECSSSITTNQVCYCYFHTDQCYPMAIPKLTKEQLDERWHESEWWIEEGDLCLMRGKTY